jgi:hypothetical protein
MIRVQCPSCGAGLRGPDEAAGKKIKCPKCGAAVPLPANAPGPDLPPAGAFDLDEPMPTRLPAADAGDDFGPAPKQAKAKPAGKAKSKARSSPEDEDLSIGAWVVAILCSGIGCIVGIVWMIQGKPKGKKMLGISILVIVVVNVINFFVMRSSMNQNP